MPIIYVVKDDKCLYANQCATADSLRHEFTCTAQACITSTTNDCIEILEKTIMTSPISEINLFYTTPRGFWTQNKFDR